MNLAHLQEILRELQASSTQRVTIPVTLSGNGEIITARGNVPHQLLVELADEFFPRALPMGCVGALLLGAGRLRGQASGYVIAVRDQLRPLQSLILVGAGMHRLALDGSSRADPLPEAAERWSRTISALGPGVWDRLVSLRFLITGSALMRPMAEAVVHLGVRMLTLAADENHFDEAVSLARNLSLRYPEARIHASRVSTILDAMRRSDLVICGGSIANRRRISAMATLYRRPLVYVGTDTMPSAALLLPGHCLTCIGPALASIRPMSDHLSAHSHDLMIALALRMIEDLVAERISASMAVVLRYVRTGGFLLAYPTIPTNRCRICELAGWADDGIDQVESLLPLPEAY